MKCRYTPRPAILTRFPFSAYAGYSSRLWYALHPSFAIPRTIAYAIIACIPIPRYAALPYVHPHRLRFSFAAQIAPFRVCKHPFRVGFVCLPRCVRRCRFPRIVPRSAFASSVVKEHCRSFASPVRGSASLATHMEINANKSRPRSRNPRFYWAFRTFAPDFHAWELPFLGVTRRNRHLTRGDNARNASANARTPAHAHTRTNARAHMHTHGRAHASADARMHTRHAPERTRAHARTRRGPRARIRARQGTGGTSARAPSAMHTRSLHCIEERAGCRAWFRLT